MTILSKLLCLDYSLKFNCYELGHTWTESCTEAALDIGSSCFRESLKLYLPIFLIPQLINKRFDLNSFKQTLTNVTRSSIFLSLNAYLAMYFFCIFRHAFGKFYYLIACWPPSFLASLLAIRIEREHRRGALALYTLNVASLTLVNNLVAKKYIPHIPNFHVLVFTLSIATQFHLMKKNGYSNDLFSSITKFLLGETEIQSQASIEKYRYHFDLYQSQYEHLKESTLNKLLTDRHRSCIHKNSCLNYVSIGFMRPFLIATGVQLASQTLFKPQKLLSEPRILIDQIKQLSNYRLGLFAGLFSSVFKLSNCLLRRTSDARKDWHIAVAALVAGPFIYLNPNNSLALYVMWKGLESTYNEAVKSKLIKHHKIYPSLLYSLATAHLFYTAIVEPEHMKPSYMRFINRVTDDQISLFNRPLFRGFFSRLDDDLKIMKALDKTRPVIPDFTSNPYKELISSWENEFKI